MKKVHFLIDGCDYMALMFSDEEIVRFKWDCEADGSEVEIVSEVVVTSDEILEDTDFEWSYKVEMASMLLLPNYKDFKKWYEQEAELKRLGYIA